MALWTRILLQKGERKRMSEAALAEAAPEPAVDTPDTSGMARGYDSSPKSIRQAVRDLRRAGWRRGSAKVGRGWRHRRGSCRPKEAWTDAQPTPATKWN